MAIVVQKFGGSSVANPDRIHTVAQRIAAARVNGDDVVVVVSAMGDTTDELLSLAHRITPNPARRELDMLLSAGERISMALLAMALEARGVPAVSFTGSQSGIITNDAHTNARIIEVRPFRVQDELARGRVVIVAGYQGVSYRREITTLGRGGSDTTAVALAAALDAASCEIYSDVAGVYTADPRVVPDARRLSEISYEEMQELAESGARVLNAQAVEFAKERGIAIYSRATTGSTAETVVRRFPPRAPGRVVGVASETGLIILDQDPATSAGVQELLDCLERFGASGKQLLFGQGGGRGHVSLVLSRDNLHDFPALQAEIEHRFGPNVMLREDLAAVSAIGAGINAGFANVLASMTELAESDIEVEGLSTSSFRISLLVPIQRVVDAVRALHRRLIPSEEPHPGELS